MIQQERVAENVYSFQSRLYAEVNAGVVISPEMAVVIDTLPFPEETIHLRDFVERELQVPIRFVINTHYHADHTWGNYLFPGVKILSHSVCRQLLLEKGMGALEKAKTQNSSLKNVEIKLPEITFDQGEIVLRVGKKTLRLFSFPGHCDGAIAVLIEEDRILFAGDTIMSVPYIVDGNTDDSINSMKLVRKMGLENIVQGHGDIILRGEIDQMMKTNIDYLTEVRKVVRKSARRKYALDVLEESDIEDCGKSRVLLGGLAEVLHKNNLIALYEQLYGKPPLGSEVYFDEKA
ncbi:MAG: MBL fold metallo-hydrolase [Anaerolineales bacterium]|jgi:glyoxylase-like metal-dependent hydrolase (beta-lactamase superfamily II)